MDDALYRVIQTKVKDLSDEQMRDLLVFVQTELRARQHIANDDPAKDSLLTEGTLFESLLGVDAANVEDALYNVSGNATNASSTE